MNRYVSFRRAEGEALWQLGRQAEAEAVYQALVGELPDAAWGYIGWSDEYYLRRGRPTDYGRAEAILLQALSRLNLDDREYVPDRLVDLYEEDARTNPIPKQVANAKERESHERNDATAPWPPNEPGGCCLQRPPRLPTSKLCVVAI